MYNTNNKLNLICAISGPNKAIGYNNKLLIKDKEDLELFKNVTDGANIVMGSKTLDSIGRELPNRVNIVLTRNKQKYQNIEKYKNILFFDNINDVLTFVCQTNTFVIGGAEIYKQFLPYCDVLHISEFSDLNVKYDSVFPDFDIEEFSLDYYKYYANFTYMRFCRK